VDRAELEGILAAKSPGAHYHQHVRGKYAHTRLFADTKKAGTAV
jgi:hypothetical protein